MNGERFVTAICNWMLGSIRLSWQWISLAQVTLNVKRQQRLLRGTSESQRNSQGSSPLRAVIHKDTPPSSQSSWSADFCECTGDHASKIISIFTSLFLIISPMHLLLVIVTDQIADLTSFGCDESYNISNSLYIFKCDFQPLENFWMILQNVFIKIRRHYLYLLTWIDF